MTESKIKTLVQNTKWIYISKIVSQILGLIATVLVLRKLAVDVFGTYNLLINSFIVFQIFTVSSVSSIFNRYIPELITNSEFRKFKKFIKGSFGFSSLFFTSLIVLLHLYKDLFASFLNIKDFSQYYLAFLVFCYASFLQILIDTVLKSLLLHKKVAIITIINAVLRTFSYIIFLNKLNVNFLLYIEIVLASLFLIQGFYIYKKYTVNLDFSIIPEVKNPVTFKRIKKYGILSFVNELGVGIVGKTSDYFIIAALSNPYNVGLYAFAQTIYRIVFKVMPFKDFQTVVRPLFFQKFVNDYKVDDFRNTFAFMIKILIPLYVIPVVYFFLFGKQIIDIVFDSKYADAYWVTVIILSSNVFLAFFFPLGLFAQLKERMDVLLYSKIIVIFSIVAGIYGMKNYGILGVATASLLGEILKNSIILFFLRKYTEIKYSFKDYKNYIIIILTISPFFLLTLFELNLFLFVLFTIIFLCYLFISFMVFHPFNTYDLELLKKIADSSIILKKVSIFIELCNNKISIILFRNRSI